MTKNHNWSNSEKTLMSFCQVSDCLAAYNLQKKNHFSAPNIQYKRERVTVWGGQMHGQNSLIYIIQECS